MAEPVTWAARFARTADDLFDGCTNISIAAAMFSKYERACTLKPDHHRSQNHPSRPRRPQLSSPALRYCILRRLEIDLNITGVPENVLPEAAKLDVAPTDPDVASSGAQRPSSLTIPTPLRFTNRPTGAARDCSLSYRPKAAIGGAVRTPFPQQPSTPSTDRASAPTSPTRATRRALR
jgi:hypothetical protein